MLSTCRRLHSCIAIFYSLLEHPLLFSTSFLTLKKIPTYNHNLFPTQNKLTFICLNDMSGMPYSEKFYRKKPLIIQYFYESLYTLGNSQWYEVKQQNHLLLNKTIASIRKHFSYQLSPIELNCSCNKYQQIPNLSPLLDHCVGEMEAS